MPDENDIAIGGGTPTAAGPIEQMASQAVHPEAQPAEPVPEKAGNPAQGPDPATEAAPVEDRKIPYSEMPLDQIPWPVCGKCEFRRGKRGLCFGGPPQVAPRALVPAPQKVATPGQPRPHVFYYQTMRPQVDERDIACGFFQPKFEPQELVDMAAKAQKAEQSGDIPTAGEAPHKHEEGCAHEEQRA